MTFITTANAAPPSELEPDPGSQDFLTATPIECTGNEPSGTFYTSSITGCPPNNIIDRCFQDINNPSKTCKIKICNENCDTRYELVASAETDTICGLKVQRQTCVEQICDEEFIELVADWSTAEQTGYEKRIEKWQQDNCTPIHKTLYRCASNYTATDTVTCQRGPDLAISCSGCSPINNPDNPSTCIQCPEGYNTLPTQLECFESTSDLSSYCWTTCSVPCTTIGQNYCENTNHPISSCKYNGNNPNDENNDKETQYGVKFYTPDNSGVCKTGTGADATRIVAKKCTVILGCNNGYHVVNNYSLAPYCAANIYTVTVDVRPQLLLDGTDPGLRITPTTFYYKYNTDAYYETNNDSQLSNPINNNNLTVSYVDPNDSANFNFSGLYEKNDPEKKILVNATGKIVSPGENIAALYQRLNNTTLYPTITAKNFIVSFDPNGGNVGKASFQYTFSKTKSNNDSCAYPGTDYATISKCTIPTKQYNVFTGYYEDIDNGQQYYTDTCNLTTARIICRHSGNLSLKAKWYECPACNPGTGATCGLSVVSNKCTYTTSCNEGYTITGNGTPNPSCTANTYTVKYFSNCSGATGTMAEITHTYDAPKNLTSNGFTCGTKKFLGWSTSSTATSATYTNGKEVKNLTKTQNDTVNLYAVWEPCTACSPSSGATCKLTAPLGVCTYETGCETGYHGITNPGKYNPSCTINSYTVVYHGNGNTGGQMGSSTRTYNDGKKLTANAFTKTGYSFTVWNTQQNGTGTTYSDKWSGNLTEAYDVTINLYAQWTANEYTVTYSCGDGTTGSPATTTDTIKYNDTYTVKGMGTCAKSGSTFIGWKIKGTTTIKQPGNEFTWKYTENIEMIVEWKQCPAGYWCPDPTTENKCPLASTSNPGATKKTDCFLQGGNSKICSIVNGTKKCYPLPNGVQAFYSGVQ